MLPQTMIDYLNRRHVVGITAQYLGEMWAASCFYAFDLTNVGLIVLTSRDTRHGQLMLKSAAVVGTISDQATNIRQIQGIQFAAQAILLDGEARKQALALYIAKHPIARLHQTDVWRIRLDNVKFTDNTRYFGYKEIWIRDDKRSVSHDILQNIAQI